MFWGDGCIGAIARYFRTRRRGDENKAPAAETAEADRKRRFLAFLEEWRTDVERYDLPTTAREFPLQVSRFREHARMIEADVGVGFADLVDRLLILKESDVKAVAGNHMLGRQKLLRRIDAVSNFVKAA